MKLQALISPKTRKRHVNLIEHLSCKECVYKHMCAKDTLIILYG